MILIGHSLLYWRGKMASNGELRYLLVASPFWALLAAGGWQWMFGRLSLKRPILLGTAAVLLPGLSNFYFHIVPQHLQPDEVAARDFLAWYDRSPLRRDYPMLLSSQPYFFYAVNEHPEESPRQVQWGIKNVQAAPPGTVLVWDAVYSVSNSDRSRVVSLREITDAGWVPRPDLDRMLVEASIKAENSHKHAALELPRWYPTAERGWHVFLSPRTAAGLPTPAESSPSTQPATSRLDNVTLGESPRGAP